MKEPALQAQDKGEWSLRIPEWHEGLYQELAGAPPLLEATPEVQRQLAALAETGGLEVELLRGGFRVTSGSFVGRVKIGPLTIVVEPKIPRAPMIELLRYAFGLRGVSTFDCISQRAARLGFEDLVALELAAEASELVARGLHQRYVAREEELQIPRGRIEFGELARFERTRLTLPCRHHLRLVDTSLNRTVAMGLSLAQRIVSDGETRALIHRVRAAFDGVIESLPSRTLLETAKRQLDRTTARYVPALTLVGLLLESTGVVLGEGQAVPLRGFLFDMNRFFQALIGRFLKEHLADGTVLEERPLRGMLQWDPLHNPARHRDPLPRPDFAVRLGEGGLELLDAKYQDLGRRPPSRDVIYQLAMYALSRDGRSRATIIYPGRRGDREQVLLVRTPSSGEGQARIVLRAVDLEFLHGLLAHRGAWRERAAYARWVALGMGSGAA